MVKNFFSSMAYSTYLRQIRKAAGLTQEGLAERVTARGHNVTAGAVSNIERGYYKKQDGSESQPAKPFVVLAAEVCGADISESLEQADYAPIKDQRDIFSLFYELPPDRQRIAERQIEGILFALMPGDDLFSKIPQDQVEDRFSDERMSRSSSTTCIPNGQRMCAEWLSIPDSGRTTSCV